jgi:transcriptional regulator with XRE-family HTH domain
VISEDGFVIANALAKVLHITQGDLADVTGLSRDSVSKIARSKSRTTQARLRDTVEIINRVSEWSGGVGRAFAWFRSQPLPSFGDKTAEDLVKEGRAEAVKAYLARIADGGYA